MYNLLLFSETIDCGLREWSISVPQHNISEEEGQRFLISECVKASNDETVVEINHYFCDEEFDLNECIGIALTNNSLEIVADISGNSSVRNCYQLVKAFAPSRKCENCVYQGHCNSNECRASGLKDFSLKSLKKEA
mgnify:CR=1 FL=1